MEQWDTYVDQNNHFTRRESQDILVPVCGDVEWRLSAIGRRLPCLDASTGRDLSNDPSARQAVPNRAK